MTLAGINKTGFVLIFLFLVTGVSSGQDVKITAIDLAGNVEYKSSSQDKFIPLSRDQKLNIGDIIKTSDSSFCNLRLGDSIFRIRENSVLTIEGPEKLNLSKGTILAKLINLPTNSKFELATPCVTAGVRGTALSAKIVDDDSVTYVATLEDSVEIEPINEPSKTIISSTFQQIEASPWQRAILSANGSGMLSENILGKDFVQNAKADVFLKATGEAIITGATNEDKEKAIKKARQNASISIYEKIILIKIDEEKDIQDLINNDPTILPNLYELINSAKVIGEVADLDKVTITIRLPIEELSTVVKQDIKTVIKPCFKISEQEYSNQFGALARVTTQRAAIVDGYRQLAEKIYKVVIDSKTTVEDFAVKNDAVKSSISGVVKGARVIQTVYYSDGSITVRLEIGGVQIISGLSTTTGNIFGTNYLCTPSPINMESYYDSLELQEITIAK